MSIGKQVTWGGRFNESPSDLMLRFSESVSFDFRLASYDVKVGKAHIKMLHQTNLMSSEEHESVDQALDKIADKIKKNEVHWNPALEDVHMNLEQLLTELTPHAAKLHTARSRNDLVATDMRLFFKEACDILIQKVKSTMQAILKIARANPEVIIPGYTHLQRAQPVYIGHHLLAYIEMLHRDWNRLLTVKDNANFSPLGSGAIAGSTLPINREMVAVELGFTDESGNPQITSNSMDAVSDRDLFMDFANACTTCAIHISRISEDIIIWNTTEFGFVKLPDAFTTGSSLMPQKKNPDSLELLRGKSARIQGNQQSLITMVKGLPLTYNRDLQEDKPAVFDSFDQLSICLEVLKGTMEGMEFNKEKCADAVKDPLLLATDLADYLVVHKVPFRDAHHIVGTLVSMAEATDTSLDQINNEEAAKIHPALKEGTWKCVFNLERAMKMRDKPGMPGNKPLALQLSKWDQILNNQ